MYCFGGFLPPDQSLSIPGMLRVPRHHFVAFFGEDKNGTGFVLRLGMMFKDFRVFFVVWGVEVR
jgi:hypothetical protein